MAEQGIGLDAKAPPSRLEDDAGRSVPAPEAVVEARLAEIPHLSVVPLVGNRDAAGGQGILAVGIDPVGCELQAHAGALGEERVQPHSRRHGAAIRVCEGKRQGQPVRGEIEDLLRIIGEGPAFRRVAVRPMSQGQAAAALVSLRHLPGPLPGIAVHGMGVVAEVGASRCSTPSNEKRPPATRLE
jgi:hypothetical protein